MVIEDTLFVLFRRIPPEKAIDCWLKSVRTKNKDLQKPICLLPNKEEFYSLLQNQFPHYSLNEAEYAYRYAQQIAENCGSVYSGVFGLLAESVKDILATDVRNECLCNYKCLLKFRELSHPIDPLIFVAAFLAKKDLQTNFKRKVFSWPISMHTNNDRLNHILDKGMSENHFHINCSSSSFHFSWLCLMNNYSASRKKEFEKENIDTYPLDTYYALPSKTDSYYVLTFKAACIRLFLFQRLRNQWVIEKTSSNESEKDVERKNIDWLYKMLDADERDCDIYSDEVNNKIYALKSLCKPNEWGFISDYASVDEPYPPSDYKDTPFHHGLAVRNYERRLYYPLSGEQRFLYDLFYAIYSGNKNICEHLDIAYAYLLIYCKLRSELIQVNNRVGFANFLKYQDRKELFTENYPEYDDMRACIAQQSVLLNPQIISFEGRLSPADSSIKLITKINRMRRLAHFSIEDNDVDALNSVNQKLHYVLHFPKYPLEYTENDEEMILPRDYKLRRQVKKQASAIIEARKNEPDIMSIVSGIDACSNEIDCRPEVFAPDFRRMRQQQYDFDGFIAEHPRPNLRITYHAGEDFLDPVDGLRAIDEAISFLEMDCGDRLGHALALGIDCEEWYFTKHHNVLLKKQALLDNLAWLYGKMHHFNIQNSAAEDQIFKWFKKLYTEIYTNNLSEPSKSIIYSVDVLDYCSSLNLRGNEPYLYYHNPDGTKNEKALFEKTLQKAEMYPWKIRQKAGLNYDVVSNALYHYYHFDKKVKYKSDERIEYYVPKCIIDAVCMIQEKMQYDISHRNIYVECNPSSNYLIGTFKDYLKHPIFRFNNKHLFSSSDLRAKQNNPRICASINTDDSGIFDTSLENEFALIACALEKHNEYCNKEDIILPDNIYAWLDYIRHQGCNQSFIRI